MKKPKRKQPKRRLRSATEIERELKRLKDAWDSSPIGSRREKALHITLCALEWVNRHSYYLRPTDWIDNCYPCKKPCDDK